MSQKVMVFWCITAIVVFTLFGVYVSSQPLPFPQPDTVEEEMLMEGVEEDEGLWATLEPDQAAN